MVLEQIVVFMMDLGPGLASLHLLHVRHEIMALSWAISGVPAHLIFALALENLWSWIILRRY